MWFAASPAGYGRPFLVRNPSPPRARTGGGRRSGAHLSAHYRTRRTDPLTPGRLDRPALGRGPCCWGCHHRLQGRDLALIAAGLTFYAGIAVVPLLVLAFSLTARLTSPERVRDLGERLTELLPSELGAPDAVEPAGGGRRRPGSAGGPARAAADVAVRRGPAPRPAALHPPRGGDDRLAGPAGRTAAAADHAVPAVPAAAGRRRDGRPRRRRRRRATTARVAVGFYSCRPRSPCRWPGGSASWAAGRCSGGRWSAARCSPRPASPASCRASCSSCPCPLDLGAPFGGLTVVGGVVAVGFWMWLLHLVVLSGWLLTGSLDDRRAPLRGGRRLTRLSRPARRPARPAGPRGAARPACSPPG